MQGRGVLFGSFLENQCLGFVCIRFSHGCVICCKPDQAVKTSAVHPDCHSLRRTPEFRSFQQKSKGFLKDPGWISSEIHWGKSSRTQPTTRHVVFCQLYGCLNVSQSIIFVNQRKKAVLHSVSVGLGHFSIFSNQAYRICGEKWSLGFGI